MTTTQQPLPTLKWIAQYTGLDVSWIDDYEIDQGRLTVRLSENFSEVDEYEVEFLVDHWAKRLSFELPTSLTDNGKEDFETLCDICGFSNEERPFMSQNL